jgi:hypothetical protein
VYGLLEAFQRLLHRKRTGSGHNSLYRKRHHLACALELCLSERKHTQDNSPTHVPIFKREPGLRAEGSLSQ